ncbi:EamA family transporter [Ralstonia pickettii]|nr:EamA family transporter [Ralstonia pickettii]
MLKAADYARLLLLAAIWGASFLFVRIAAPAIGGIPTAFFRVLLGALGLVGILLLIGVQPRFKGHFRTLLVLGAVNSGIPLLMYALAAKVLPAGYLAIFNATTPLMGVVIGSAFFGERPDMMKILGVPVGIFGVVLLAAAGPMTFTAATTLGVLACLVATSCYAIAGFLTKRWIAERGGLDAKLVAFGSQIGATLFLLPFLGVAAVGAPDILVTIPHTPMLLFALGMLGLVCTAWAYILYFRLIADIGPVRSLAVTFLIPPFGVLWGVLFLHERLSWAHALGGALVGVALILVLVPKSRKVVLKGA